MEVPVFLILKYYWSCILFQVFYKKVKHSNDNNQCSINFSKIRNFKTKFTIWSNGIVDFPFKLIGTKNKNIPTKTT